jgi:predicted short-subunit dehydrogenase-like oxidoreductase (DUF2520 family)
VLSNEGGGGFARVAVIGPGRMGQGVALALARRRYEVFLLGRGPREVVPPLRLHDGPWSDALPGAGLVILATPDDAIPHVAAELAAQGMIHAAQVVLHLSGLLDRRALQPLEPTGAALGSFHPLQTIADPATAPERLEGAYAAIEGDDRAMHAAEWLASAIGMLPLPIRAEAKPAYHAAASLVSNYTAALLGVAERIAVSAGIPPEVAAKIYLPLLRGTAANLELLGPTAALTGPVRRGDLHTIQVHLSALTPSERELYRRLALASLELARQAGLDPALADRVQNLLND